MRRALGGREHFRSDDVLLVEMSARLDIARIMGIPLLAVLLLAGSGMPATAGGAQAVTVASAGQDTSRILDMRRQNELARLYTTGFKYYQISEFAAAIPAFREYTKRDSTNTEAWHYLATCYVQTQQYEEARGAYRAVLRQDPTDLSALRGLAWLHNELGDRELYIKTYERIVELAPESVEDRQVLESLYRREGDDRALVSLLEKQAEQNPEDAGVRQRISEVHRRSGDMEAEAKSLEEALERDPENVGYLDRLARIYENELDRPCDAAGLYRRISDLRGEDALVWRKLGRTLLQCGTYEEAAEAFRRSLELAPEQIRVYSEWGRALMEMGDFDAAEEAVGKAIARQPDDGYAYVTWGDILWAKGFAVAEGDQVPYEAKIVLEQAIEQYQQGVATGTLSPEVAAYAQRRARELEPYRRTPAEIFMQRARKKDIPPSSR